MPLKFDITLTAEDMYRFNMYQTYSGFHGWFSIAFSILIFVVAGVTRGKLEAAYTALSIVFGCTYRRRKRVRCFRGSRSIKWSRRSTTFWCTAAGSMPMSFREHSWGKATRHCRHRLRHICRRTV